MKYLPHLYFISIISIFYYPNWSVIDPKAQHWFHVSIINTIYFGYIIFSEKKYLYKVFKSPIFKSIFAFFLISCISATYAINYIESIVKITDIYVLLSSILIILYFCYSNKVSKTVLLYTILITLILDLAGSFYQILQIVQYNEFSFEFSNAIKSIYGNKNIAAMSYMLKIPMILILLLRSKNYVFKSLLLVVITTTFYILFLLSSRTSFLAIILSIFVVVSLLLIKKVIYKNEIKKDLQNYKFFILPLIIAFIIFKLSINQSGEISFEKRVTSIVENKNDASSYERFRFYGHAINYIASNPLLGCGIGNWRLMSIKYDSKTMYSYVVPYFAHNDFLEIFAETGFFGFLSYLLFFFYLFKEILKNILLWLKSKGNYISVLFLMCFMYYLIDANLNFPLDRPTMQVPLLFLIALVYSNKYSNAE